jgi:DNA invertase Pin-like site-specific DNA recombinase
MVCIKCGYSDIKEIKKNGYSFCSICSNFIPENKKDFDKYINEKIDWKILDTFRKYNCSRGEKQKIGMMNKAIEGHPVTRAPYGYSITSGKLEPNENSLKVILIYRNFIAEDISLNMLSKKFNFSINGIKKILQNRTYLGEIKFDKQFIKSNHKPIIDQETFYAVQRKIETKCNKYKK